LVGDRCRPVLQLSEQRQPLRAESLDLRLREGWVEDDIREERQRAVELPGRRVQRDRRRIPARAGLEPHAEERLLVGDLERRPCRRSFVEERGGERREARVIARIGLVAAAHDERKVSNGEFMMLDDQ
jgi:hypothetical protein